MKDFPRIHSIGTINIIHHQNFDYELHPFRTDFTGDSGVGKSILTDLLQLIIIGSTQYESSTNSKDDRPFNTLVIETSEKGDYGYAYLNIEVKKEEYLLIGCYIERKAKQSQAFIVQGSLDFEQKTFDSFLRPFTVEDFVQDNTLLTLVDFDRKMNHSDHFGCHIYTYFRDYHEALFRNNLLPIDIANSKTDLCDYAKILQAFSRKGISVKNDVQLQEFLFGKEENLVFYNKYLETVRHFEDSVNMHRTNKEDIKILKGKGDNIKTLYEIKKQKDAAFREFVEVDWNYQKITVESSKKSIKNLIINYLQARTAIEELNVLKTSKLKEIREKIKELQPRLDEISTEFDRIKRRSALVDDCMAIKEELNLDTNIQLRNVVDAYFERQKLDAALDSLTNSLERHGLFKAFEKLDFEGGLQSVVKAQNEAINGLEQKLSFSNELVKFNDFNNPNTLSHWILKRNKACSPMEESMLRHFHDLETILPEFAKADSKYVPDPSQLISALNENKFTLGNDGFWLDLSGLNIYIKYVEKQIFDITDNSKIKALLTKSKKQIESQIEQIKKDISDQKELQSFLLNELPKIPYSLTAWLSRNEESLSQNMKEAIAKIASENLEQIFEDLKNKKQLSELYVNAERSKNDLNKTIRALESTEQQLPKIETKEIETLSQKVERQIVDLSISQNHEDIKFSFQQDSFAIEFQKEYFKQEEKLDDIDGLDILLQTKTDAANRVLEIETTYSEWLPEFLDLKVEEDDYKNSSSKYEKYLSDYSKQFDGMIIGYQLTDKSEQFKNDKNFMELVRLLLPHQLFKEISFDEAAVIPKIIEYLDEINDANARLNQNKLISIRDLLQELRSAVNMQVSHSRKMNSFFQEDYMEIASDNTASLKAELRRDISLQWINDFLSNLGKFDFGLFDRENSLTSKMEDSPTLQEKILLAYKEHSATPLPNITIRQLLDPFSYYTLNYELVTKNGKKNSGSTGQTYSSIALLCIAKLSLIKDGKVNKNPGLRFLSIDEAEGIGSNFDMLNELAEEFDYQIISLGINPNKLSRKNQYIYRLTKRKDLDNINHHPSVIFCEL
jgi:hypothetical protein